MAAMRRGRVFLVARAADDAVSRLAAIVQRALDAGRRGAALTVAGTDPPGPELEAAADALIAGAGDADAARRALDRLAGTLGAVAPGTVLPPLSTDGQQMRLFAAQLREAADAATAFVERRHAAEAIVAALGDALAALDRDDPAAAIERLDATGPSRRLLDEWKERPPLMSYWMGVTGDLIDAARGIATATLAGDTAAQRAAAQRYATASEAARGADNALAVTLTEEGAATSAGALQRLAAAAGEASDLRKALSGLIDQAP